MIQPETLALLDDDRRALLASVDRIREGDRSTRPSDGRWSVADILEHLAGVEASVAKRIAIRGREPVPANQPRRAPDADARLVRLRARERRIQVPDTLRPTGGMSAAEAIAALGQSREALLSAGNAADPDALMRRTYHHRELGRLTLQDWLAFVAHHGARHTAQIEEIAAALVSGSR